MAGQRLTDKTALTENLASGDLLMAVDVSDNTGSAAGTSKKVEIKYIIQTDKTSIDIAGLKSLSTSAVTLVAAPGAGYAIIPFSVCIVANFAFPPDITGADVYVGYVASGTTNFWGIQEDPMNGILATATFIITGYYDVPKGGSHIATIANLPLYMYSSANFGGGLNFDVYTTYQIIKL